jgi:hypothetical protein
MRQYLFIQEWPRRRLGAPRDPAHTDLEVTVDTIRISPVGDPFTAAPHHDDHDERSHACNDGWVTIGQLVVDPKTGEETEEFALYLCRRCNA